MRVKYRLLNVSVDAAVRRSAMIMKYPNHYICIPPTSTDRLADKRVDGIAQKSAQNQNRLIDRTHEVPEILAAKPNSDNNESQKCTKNRTRKMPHAKDEKDRPTVLPTDRLGERKDSDDELRASASVSTV